MNQVRLISARLFWALVTLLLVSVLTFAMIDLLPGDAANASLGRFASDQQLEIFRERHQLNDPALQRYLRWIGSVLQGDFGMSLGSGVPVRQIVLPKLSNSVFLALLALAIFIPLVIVTAFVQAVRRNRPVDHVLSFITLTIFSIPDFLLGTLILLLFVLAIPVLPAISYVDSATSIGDYLLALIMPALTIALVMTVHTVRMLRDNLIEVLDTDYVRMAVLKGIRQRRVLFLHAFPNALVPTLNIIALNFAYLIGGVVVVEKVFVFPGIGSLLVDSIKNLDYPVILISTLIAAAFYIAANLAADLLTIALNPRLRNS